LIKPNRWTLLGHNRVLFGVIVAFIHDDFRWRKMVFYLAQKILLFTKSSLFTRIVVCICSLKRFLHSRQISYLKIWNISIIRQTGRLSGINVINNYFWKIFRRSEKADPTSHVSFGVHLERNRFYIAKWRYQSRKLLADFTMTWETRYILYWNDFCPFASKKSYLVQSCRKSSNFQ